MILSRNEVTATLAKAARGQGVPQGHADVVVPAAVAALGLGVAPDDVTAVFCGPHVAADFKQTRVAMAGPIAVDMLLCGTKAICLEQVDSPPVLKCLLDNAIIHNGLRAELEVMRRTVIVRLSATTTAPETSRGPLSIDDTAWALWQSWAALTYVPESDASRLGGAGAGLTDND